MKRLRDLGGSCDPIEVRAARLLSSRRPLADDAARKQRVRARLRRRRPSGQRILRVALTLMVVCTVAVAGAAVGRVAKTLIVRYRETHPAPAPTPKQKTVASHRGRAIAGPIDIAPPLAIEPAVAPEPAIAPPINSGKPLGTASGQPTRLAPLGSPIAPAPPAEIAPAPKHAVKAPPELISDEQRLLTAAVRALRHDHNPERAANLLTRYLAEYPDSAAAEDMFALALEATLGRDPARAATLARDYLARFPSGRWAALAESALPR